MTVSKNFDMRNARQLAMLIVIVFTLSCRLQAQPETPTLEGVQFIKSLNGMNCVLMQRSEGSTFDLNVHVRTGSVYDPDSLSGTANLVHRIISEKITSFLNKGTGQVSSSNS